MDQLELSIVKAWEPRNEYIPLSPLDIYLGHYATGGVHFFTEVPDTERMKQALAVALGRHPSFGACMVRESNNIALYCGEPGTKFSVYRSAANCPDFWSSHSLIEPELLAETNSASYTFNCGEPISHFRLVIFKDRGCALVIQHVHSQADGAAVIHFLQTWSKAYRGQLLAPHTAYSRAQILRLATASGLKPSAKLNIVSMDRDTPVRDSRRDSGEPRDGGAIRIDVAQATLDAALRNCRLASRARLTVSDMLHALIWKCFGLSQNCAAEQSNQLYTLFDLRGIKALGIPQDYEGSAVLGRFAAATYGDIRALELPLLAALFRQQVKPLTAAEACEDISYLASEYASGRINENGNYSNFVIGAWRDCRDERGLVVNDLCTLANADIAFEDRSARIETLVSNEVNMVSIYRNDDGTITFHYVGERSTLPIFAHHLKLLLREKSCLPKLP